MYDAITDLVREPEDVAALITGAARDLAGQNVRYAELTVTPYSHVRRGMPMRAVTEALDVASREAEAAHGVRVAYIFDIAAELGAEAAGATLEHALNHPAERLVAFGLAGLEQQNHPDAAAFADAFRAATKAGLHSVPHAGETTGPPTIWWALGELGAQRIAHGITCLDDPKLVAHLRERQIPLDVCPTSNVRTGVVPGIAEHPLPRLVEEGLFVTLNTDDPPMFGTTLNQEYRVAAEVFGLDPKSLARNSIRASFLDAPGKQALLAEIG